MASSLRINRCGALGNPLETPGCFALEPFSWAMTSACLQGASTPAYKRNERNANPRNGVWQIIEQAMRDIRSCAVCVTREELAHAPDPIQLPGQSWLLRKACSLNPTVRKRNCAGNDRTTEAICSLERQGFPTLSTRIVL